MNLGGHEHSLYRGSHPTRPMCDARSGFTPTGRHPRVHQQGVTCELWHAHDTGQHAVTDR